MTLLLCAFALPAGIAACYLLLATILSRGLHLPPASKRVHRFDVIVPAHDEAQGIGRTVSSLLRVDWPPEKRRVVVVADNCSDSTASIARAAGATVMERNDQTRLGKGYALNHAFDASLAEGWADAVVVIDADSEVSPNLLESMAARLDEGAAAVQVDYGALNPHSSWRTQLMAIALASFHMVRSRARERLKLSSGLRGNGWCVTHQALHETPFCAYSLTEDVEYGIALGLRGIRVHYAEEAVVKGEMAASERVARSQRQRWESGRWALVRSQVAPLIRRAWQTRRLLCLDLALDLLVPPLSYVALNIMALIVLSWLGNLRYPDCRIWLWLGIADALVLALYVVRGWTLSGTGGRGVRALAFAPVFLVWKLALMATHRPSRWVRTARERV
jgi:cellulose synthase/poly-beta-1,6-N-acetylglucosamine synthase-like glycosyltransferase